MKKAHRYKTSVGMYLPNHRQVQFLKLQSLNLAADTPGTGSASTCFPLRFCPLRLSRNRTWIVLNRCIYIYISAANKIPKPRQSSMAFDCGIARQVHSIPLSRYRGRTKHSDCFCLGFCLTGRCLAGRCFWGTLCPFLLGFLTKGRSGIFHDSLCSRHSICHVRDLPGILESCTTEWTHVFFHGMKTITLNCKKRTSAKGTGSWEWRISSVALMRIVAPAREIYFLYSYIYLYV